jgi:hypothetical protein
MSDGEQQPDSLFGERNPVRISPLLTYSAHTPDPDDKVNPHLQADL